jgi:hypothetical protein
MTKPGRDADGVAQTESDHFMKCPGCGQWFDMRDLAQVVQLIHDNEIEKVRGASLVAPRRSGALKSPPA